MTPSSDSSGLISLGSMNTTGKLQSGSWGTWVFSTLSLLHSSIFGKSFRYPVLCFSTFQSRPLAPKFHSWAAILFVSPVSSLTRLSQLRPAAPPPSPSCRIVWISFRPLGHWQDRPTGSYKAASCSFPAEAEKRDLGSCNTYLKMLKALPAASVKA